MDTPGFRVVVVADAHEGAGAVFEALRSLGAHVSDVAPVPSPDEAIGRVQSGTARVLAFHHRHCTRDLVAQARAARQDVLVITFGPHDDEDDLRATLEVGADGYVIVGRDELGLQVRQVLHQADARAGNRPYRFEPPPSSQRPRRFGEEEDGFIVRVSHELRTPLTAVAGTLEILADDLAGTLSPPLQECMDIALRNVAQLRRMILDLVDTSRPDLHHLKIEPGCAHVADLAREVVDTQAMHANFAEVEIELALPGPVPAVRADPARFRQILGSLIDNAVKFSAPKGLVQVTVDLDDPEPGYVTVAVHDLGGGVEPDFVSHIFDPFIQDPTFESSRRGLGLGLYITKELVHRQGGRIWVDSTPGVGSTFAFTLPVFSLAHLIQPLVGPDTGETLACIGIEVYPPDAKLELITRDNLLEEAKRIARDALRGDDTLVQGLPEVNHSGLVIIMASSNDVGARAISHRLESRLSSSKVLEGIGLEATVDFIVVRPALFGHDPEKLARHFSTFIRDRFAPTDADVAQAAPVRT